MSAYSMPTGGTILIVIYVCAIVAAIVLVFSNQRKRSGK